MTEKNERNLTLIESTKVETRVDEVKKPTRQTNPIAKKFVDFHFNCEHKFDVKDLFKKP